MFFRIFSKSKIKPFAVSDFRDLKSGIGRKHFQQGNGAAVRGEHGILSFV